MDFNAYQETVESKFKVHEGLCSREARVLDWSMGLAGETGEVCDLIKHAIFHGEEVKLAELAKELGDVLWYLTAIAASHDIPMQVIADLNIAKLNKRYKDGYSDEESANRKATEFSIEQVFEDMMEEATGENWFDAIL